MKVLFYSGMQNMIEKSGVGRAIYHQRLAAKENRIELAQGLDDADLVHINTVFPRSLLLAKQARKRGIPVIYHAHSTREDFRNSFIGSNLAAPLFGKWIKHCYSAGTMIVTPTEYSKRLLESYGIDRRIEAVSNGIDLTYYDRSQADGAAFREKYGYTADQKVIMCVGLTIERKGIDDFVALARELPEYQFIWFGETNPNTLPPRVRSLLRTDLPNLKFAGYAKPVDLRDAYAGSDLFLFPSREETEGIVVLEALAMRIPVLLRRIPVYSDWLREDTDVYKADSVSEFALRAKSILDGTLPDLTANGYEVAKSRSIDLIGARLARIYQECAAMTEPARRGTGPLARLRPGTR